MLETPSRIWRRIEAVENNDMPSLPSLPPFEDSAEAEDSHEPTRNDDDHQFDEDFDSLISPLHSTPTSTHHTVTSTVNGPSSTSSTARFAHSIASRSNKSLTASSRGTSTRRNRHESFEIPSLPQIPAAAAHRYGTDEEGEEEEQEESKSVPDVYLPPPDDEDDQDREFSLTDALQSLSRSSSPPFIPETFSREETPKKNYDFSMSLKSEPKVCLEFHNRSALLTRQYSLLLLRNIGMLLFVTELIHERVHLRCRELRPHKHHRRHIPPLKAIALLHCPWSPRLR